MLADAAEGTALVYTVWGSRDKRADTRPILSMRAINASRACSPSADRPDNLFCVFGEVRNTGAWHREVAHCALDSDHHLRGGNFERCRGEVAVKQIVQVFIVAHSQHDILTGLVADELARVAVGNSRGKFLHRQIRKRLI